ncbi:hypothetical protein MM213_08780 [Belliella sp. R4-6]|uniref:Uncharacterized protein n=1 Tax=Belliella alkalica TaxID=1730871 RepID=A0ABS9VAW7_9BACT|nr:hypothetical protein [Belliella alkalica]MCH7413576.1 hypothetical protein [Belliella alkalica]
MVKNLSKYFSLICGAISIALMIVIFGNPPTDFDGGPMFAYNFLFFLPLLIGIGLLTSIAFIISIKKILKNSEKSLNIFSVVLATPGFFYFGLYLIRIIIIYVEPEPMELPNRIEVNRTSIVLDGKTIHLTGFNLGVNYTKRRVYISGIPYFNSEFNSEDAYFCQGDSTFELFYTSTKDSIFVYIPKTEPMYFQEKSKDRYKVPVRAIQLSQNEIYKLKINEGDSIKRFHWN